MTGTTDASRRASSLVDPWAAAWTAVIAVLLLGVWWFGVQWFEADRIQARRVIVEGQATQYRTSLQMAVSSRAALVQGLRAFVERQERTGTLTQESFDTFAQGQYAIAAGIRTIQIAPMGVIRWTYPLTGNRAAIGLDLKTHSNAEVRADALRALDTTMVTVSSPFTLVQGGTGLAMRQSVHVNGKLWGLAAVISDMSSLLSESGVSHPPADMTVVVWDSHDRVIAGRAESLPPDPVRERVRLPDGTWRLAVAPTVGWAAWVAAAVDPVRWLGLFVVALLSAFVYGAVSRQHRLTRMVGERTAALAESEQRYRTLFEESPVSLWEEDFSGAREACEELKARGITDIRAYLTDNPGELRRIADLMQVRDVNRATVRLYGAADRGQLLGGLSAFITKTNEPDFVEHVAAVFEGAKSLTLMTHTEDSDDALHLALTWTAVPGHDDYSSIVVCIMDLTDRVRAERAMQSYREDLERLVAERTRELVEVNEDLIVAQEAKDAFLASMSHELRTPLNSILGFTGVILQGAAGPLTEEQSRQLEMVRKSGRDLLALVNEVLDLSKIEGGFASMACEDFEVAPLLSAVADTLRPLADQKGIGLEVNVAGDAPALVCSDRDRVRQILLNLLGNAIKFTQSGHVGLEAHIDGEFVVMAVSDTGPGIPVEEAESIFAPFRQLSRDSGANATGTGLGLSISRDLASLLGGTLVLAHTDGTGSRFELRLPIEGPGAGDTA